MSIYAPPQATWISWTPSWTNLTIGNGTLVFAKYWQEGKFVSFRLTFKLGSTSSVSGQIIFSLPITAASDEVPANSEVNFIGFGNMLDSGVNQYELGVSCVSTTTAASYAFGAAGTFASTTSTSATIPGTWSTSDVFSCRGFYEAA